MIFLWFWLIFVDIFHDFGWLFATQIRFRIRNMLYLMSQSFSGIQYTSWTMGVYCLYTVQYCIFHIPFHLCVNSTLNHIFNLSFIISIKSRRKRWERSTYIKWRKHNLKNIISRIAKSRFRIKWKTWQSYVMGHLDAQENFTPLQFSLVLNISYLQCCGSGFRIRIRGSRSWPVKDIQNTIEWIF